jgi:hypothetical protein
MKRLTTIVLVVMLSPVLSKGDGNFEKAMKKALGKMNQAASIDDFQQVANQFDRIANVETDNWLPVYHAAYSKVMMAAMEEDTQKKDPYLDAAQQNLDAIEEMEHDETERLALQGFLTMIRMSVDPARGMELGMECGMIVNRAYTLNNQNPRSVLMLAQFNHGTASYMGQDTSEACAMFDEVIKLLDEVEAGKRDPFLPSWGRNMASMMQQQCKQ